MSAPTAPGGALDKRTSGDVQQWSQPSIPTATCGQRGALLLALQPPSQKYAHHVSSSNSGKAVSHRRQFCGWPALRSKETVVNGGVTGSQSIVPVV